MTCATASPMRKRGRNRKRRPWVSTESECHRRRGSDSETSIGQAKYHLGGTDIKEEP